MSNYYILKFVVGDNDYYAERVSVSDEDMTEWSQEGVSLKGRNPQITLKRNRGTVRNYIGNLYSLPIVSELITQVISKHCPDEIELIEIEVEKKVNQKYYFLNLLHLVNCIDMEQSVYKLFFPDTLLFESIDRLILNAAAIHYNIFLVDGLTLQIVVSEKLKSALEQLQIPDITFYPVEELVKDFSGIRSKYNNTWY